MSKKAVWRLATILVIVFLLLLLCTKLRLLTIMGLIIGSVIMKPIKLWCKIVGFVAEIIYSMIGDDDLSQPKTE